MDTKQSRIRHLAKTVTWRLVGTVDTILLGWLVHPACCGLSAFVGAGLVFAGITDTCGMGLLLARMPWNRYGQANSDPGP